MRYINLLLLLLLLLFFILKMNLQRYVRCEFECDDIKNRCVQVFAQNEYLQKVQTWNKVLRQLWNFNSGNTLDVETLHAMYCSL